MLLNQFGATFFGIMLTTAAYAAQSQRVWLMVFAGTFSTLFYLFLIYNVLWERGGQDRIRADSGRAARQPLKGLWITLVANIPNILIAAVILVSNPFKADQVWAVGMNAAGRGAALLWEGMYNGFVYTFAPHNPLIFVLEILPAIVVGFAAYYLGFSNKRLLQPFELRQPSGDKKGSEK